MYTIYVAVSFAKSYNLYGIAELNIDISDSVQGIAIGKKMNRAADYRFQQHGTLVYMAHASVVFIKTESICAEPGY